MAEYESYASETLVVSNVAKPFTASVHNIGRPADRAIISVAGAGIRFWYDGTTPTASVGHDIGAGGQIVVEGAADVAGFRAIRDSGSDSTLSITYQRRTA